MDFIVELPPGKGFNTILVIVDRFSKMAHFIPLKGLPSSSELATTFIREVIRLHGIPEELTSDRGSQFVSRFWINLCKALGISLATSSAYHPQTNGQTERTNQTLEQYIRCFSSSAQDNWPTLLPLAEFAYNNSRHSSTELSPFQVNYGFHPNLLPESPRIPNSPAAQNFSDQLVSHHRSLRTNLAKAQQKYKKFADRKRNLEPALGVGDKVMLSTKNLKLRVPSKKLGPKFIGPFPIVAKINRVTYKLRLPSTYRVHPVFHISLLRRCRQDLRLPDQPLPIQVDGSEEYEVETILDVRRRGQGLQYLVKWKGFGVEENSWEPARNVHAPALIKAFFLKHPEKNQLRVVRRPPLRGGQCQDAARLISERRAPPGSAGRRVRPLLGTRAGAQAHSRPRPCSS